MTRWLFVLFCVIAAVSLYMHFQQPVPSDSQIERGGPQLPPSNYELAKGGTVFVWRDLDTGDIRRERVVEADGRLMLSDWGDRRSFAYVPDPWADSENTDPADIEPLFPLEVGKKVTFHRQPAAGRTVDTVEVVRTETLSLPIGKVDTYVIETTSKLESGSWVGTATVWYAPSVRWQVRWLITDTAGDRRRREVIAMERP
jgi:hypothetical protein